MIDSKLVNDVWPWLPAFRAVAETQHLGEAGKRMHVVPSALSRSLRLLEESMGAPLFDRQGRRLWLNARGRALLEQLRGAMGQVERGLDPTATERLDGELRVSTLGVMTGLVTPVLLEMTRVHPRLVPAMKICRASEANHRLATSDLDVAFYYDAVDFDGVAFRKLGALTNSVYCGRGHALFGKRVTIPKLLEHPFSVPAAGDHNTPMDNWPLHLPRRIGMRIETLVTNIDVCRSGRFLTVLPDVVGRPLVAAKEAWVLENSIVPPTFAYGAHRTGEGNTLKVSALLEGVELELKKYEQRRSK